MERSEHLKSLLKSLCLPCFADHYTLQAENAEREKIDHVGYLYELSKIEYERRCQQRVERLIRQAKLPRDKRLTDFEVARVEGLSPSLITRLAGGEFIDRCENILIFGNPGSGKSHLSIAFAYEWCLKGRRILYTTAAAITQELLRAKKNIELDLLIKKLDRFEVIVIDDISYVSCNQNETDVLFMLLAARYEQRSIVITSNLAFSQWQQIFKDEMTTAAAIDRLVHHAIVLELNAPSFRMQEAQKNKGKEEKVN